MLATNNACLAVALMDVRNSVVAGDYFAYSRQCGSCTRRYLLAEDLYQDLFGVCRAVLDVMTTKYVPQHGDLHV